MHIAYTASHAHMNCMPPQYPQLIFVYIHACVSVHVCVLLHVRMYMHVDMCGYGHGAIVCK